MRLSAALAALAVTAAACGGTEPPEARAEIVVTSPAFEDGAPFPVEHTCDGADRSPALAWSRVPARAAELAIVMIDADVPGRFVHWLVYGIDPLVTSVGTGALPEGAFEGANSFGDVGYGGPCPPSGDRPHRYAVSVFALARSSGLGAGATFAELDRASPVIDRGTVVGIYAR